MIWAVFNLQEITISCKKNIMISKKLQLFRQEKDSQMCGPSSLAFAMSQFGEKLLPKDISKELNISKEFGIGLFDLALFPINRSFNVEIFAWDGANFPVNWHDASQKEIIKDLSKEKLSTSSWKYSLLNLLKKGAVFHAKPITPEELDNYLQKGFSIIIYLDSAVLYKHASGIWGHYVVLENCNKKNWKIFDPHWKYGGHKRYSKDLILFSFYSVGGYCFMIKK